jgi:hypothetical protein
MEAHYNLPWVKLMKTMKQAHPSGTKPRFYPDAPSIKAFMMDFSPGFDVSKSSYALAEGHHYANGQNPFASRDKYHDDNLKYDYLAGVTDLFGDNVPPPEDMYANSALQDVNSKLYHNKQHLHREVTIRDERERSYKTKFRRMVNHNSNGESSGSAYYTATPSEADEAQQAFLKHRDFMYETPVPIKKGVKERPTDYYSEPRPKRVLKTVPQMTRFFAHKGIVSYDHTPVALKRQLEEMRLTSEYEAFVRRTRKSRGL